MIDIEQYKNAQGFYDTEQMMVDAGVNSRAAAFDAIFGDVQGTPEMAPAWAAAVDAAKAYNAALLQQIESQREAEARSLIGVALSRVDFAEWAVATYGADYDLVRMVDMARSLDYVASDLAALPGDLVEIVRRRKANNPTAADARTQREAAARDSVAAAGGRKATTWPRETWKRLQALGYAWYTGPDETGHWYAGLNDDGERLVSGHARSVPGDYADQAVD